MTKLQKKLLKILVWNAMMIVCVGGVLWVCGVEVLNIVSGLGVGGLLLMFLVKDLISSIASAFVISSCKLYDIGDFVEINSKAGVVEDISLSFTTLGRGTECIIKVPNSEAISKGVKVFDKDQNDSEKTIRGE